MTHDTSDDTQVLLRRLLDLQAESLSLQRLLVERLATQQPESPEPERPPLRVVGRTAARAERYYQAAARPSGPPPVSLEQLETLRAIQDAGETARLVLAFGPHAGETLGQVAQTDPAYLRTLALSARRPDVRAAAERMLAVLPAPSRRSRRNPSAGESGCR